jgi:quercetin dioxygenase-like cupin family protein
MTRRLRLDRAATPFSRSGSCLAIGRDKGKRCRFGEVDMSGSRAIVGRIREEDQAAFETPPRTAYFYFGAREGLNMGAGICVIPEGSSNQKHAHDDADEVIYVLKGEVRFVFPDEAFVLKPFEAVYIPRGLDHQIFNVGKGEAAHTFTFAPAEPADRIRRKYK